MAGTPVAQGIIKQTAVVKQSGLGVAGSGAGGQVLRRITSVFTANRATFESNEIITHEQSTGVAYGTKTVAGKLSGLASAATYKLFMASACRKDFVAGSTTGAIVTVTSAVTSGAQGTFTRSGGSFLTDGFKIGDMVRWTGWATTGVPCNSTNYLILNLTALVMTVVSITGVAIGPKAAGDSVTCLVVGKKTLAPLTGHTNDYFTVEEWYSDLSKSEIFIDCKVNQIDVALPASGNATVGVDLIGLSRVKGVAQVLTAPTVATTTNIMAASNGMVIANGAILGAVTAGSISIVGGMTQGDAVVGSNAPVDVSRGRIKVSGSFTALFTDTVISDLYDAETPTSLVLLLTDNPTNALSDFLVFNMSRIKITGDAPDDGEKTITRTFPFTAEININGGAALANDNTILTIQDSAA